MDELSTEDLQKGIAAFLMCFGQGLPDPLKQSIRDRTHQLAGQIERGGEPTVARIAKALADALVVPHQPPPTH